jgi:hypothetical protein
MKRSRIRQRPGPEDLLTAWRNSELEGLVAVWRNFDDYDNAEFLFVKERVGGGREILLKCVNGPDRQLNSSPKLLHWFNDRVNAVGGEFHWEDSEVLHEIVAQCASEFLDLEPMKIHQP